MRDLMALSVRQPWGYAITRGYKTVIGRPEPTSHRGLVVVHAAANWSRAGEKSPLLAAKVRGRVDNRDDRRFPRRVLLAVAELADCHGRDGCTPWAGSGDWHWQLANIWPLPQPIPAQGQPGIWRLSPNLAAAVCAQLLPEAQRA